MTNWYWYLHVTTFNTTLQWNFLYQEQRLNLSHNKKFTAYIVNMFVLSVVIPLGTHQYYFLRIFTWILCPSINYFFIYLSATHIRNVLKYENCLWQGKWTENVSSFTQYSLFLCLSLSHPIGFILSLLLTSYSSMQ